MQPDSFNPQPRVFDRRLFSRINLVMAILSLAIGIVLLGGSIRWTVRHHHFISHAVATTCRVVELRRDVPSRRDHSRSMHRDSYRAIISFTDANGGEFTFPDQLATSPPQFAVGDMVQIFYDPQDASDATVDREKRIYLIPGILSFVGLLCLLGGTQRLKKRNITN